MINIPTNKPKNNSNRSRIIAVIKSEPGIMTRKIESRLTDLTKREIENALHALRNKNTLVCQRQPGKPGHWYILNDPYSATKETPPPPPKKPSAAGDNITPGHLINRMVGTYILSRQSPMRPGANDHLQHPSRRNDDRVEHRAPFGMQSTPRHFSSRVADDLNYIKKQASK